MARENGRQPQDGKSKKHIWIALGILFLIMWAGSFLTGKFNPELTKPRKPFAPRLSAFQPACRNCMNSMCEKLPAGFIAASKRVVVMECRKDKPSKRVYIKELGDWYANLSNHDRFTVFAIYRDAEKVGVYSMGGDAYKRFARISVMEWPDKTVKGCFTVYGNHPPRENKYFKGSTPPDLYGDRVPDERILKAIKERLPSPH